MVSEGRVVSAPQMHGLHARRALGWSVREFYARQVEVEKKMHALAETVGPVRAFIDSAGRMQGVQGTLEDAEAHGLVPAAGVPDVYKPDRRASKGREFSAEMGQLRVPSALDLMETLFAAPFLPHAEFPHERVGAGLVVGRSRGSNAYVYVPTFFPLEDLQDALTARGFKGQRDFAVAARLPAQWSWHV